MAAENWLTVHPLIGELEDHPRDFSFFRAVWLLERAQSDAARVGGLGPARRETVRLRPEAGLGFPSADVTAVEERPPGEEGARFSLSTPILGLYGVTSPLPCFYSEDILKSERLGEEDQARLFFDVLNHRLLSLLYRAWAKYRWHFTFEQEGQDPTSSYLKAWLGLATEPLQRRAGVSSVKLLRYAGLAGQRPRNASAIAGIVSDYFGDVPVELDQCVARWVDVPAPDRSRLGVANSTLGQDVVVGETILDRSGKCRIQIGPVDFDKFQTLRPGGEGHSDACAIARLMLPDSLDFDFRLILDRNEVPAARISTGDDATQLGIVSWLVTGPAPEDKAVNFAPAAAA
ncbi:MAG: type VI secretion system baseplate subunit TssG [Myxococcota bacterium]